MASRGILTFVRSRLVELSGKLAPLELRARTTAAGARESLEHVSQQTVDTANFIRERWKTGGASALREDAHECLQHLRERLQASAWRRWWPQPWERYKLLLFEQPMLCNCLTAGVLYGAGDCIAQLLEKRLLGIESAGSVYYNVPRTVRMVVFGFTLAGPTYCFWYPQLQKMTVAYRDHYKPIRMGFLDLPFFRRQDLKDPSQRAMEVAVKVMVDNLFFQPPFLTVYFLIMGILEGLSFSTVYDKTRQNFHDAWGLAVLVWVPVQSVNFWFMPVYLQAPFTQLMNMAWKVGLSLFYHSRDHSCNHGSADLSLDMPEASEGVAVERVPAETDRTLEEQVEQLRVRVEAILARQRSQAEAVAKLRGEHREHLLTLQHQTEVLAALVEQAELQRSELVDPLVTFQQQLDKQTDCISLQATELARFRTALMANKSVQHGSGAQGEDFSDYKFGV